MPTWIIEPRDPLIVRDGRPFGLIPGARARTLAFPFPSTTTGAMRTRVGQNAQGVFQKARTAAVKKLAVRGPLLVALNAADEVMTWYAPAPADAVIMEGAWPAQTKSECEAHTRIKRVPLVPLVPPPDAQHNLPKGLAFVGAVTADPSRPVSRPPAFWSWPAFAQWLTAPAGDAPEGVCPDSIGIAGPGHEERTHVKISADTQTAAEGALFQTSGLEFTTKARSRLALALVADEQLMPGLTPFGGESRVAAWRASAQQLPDWPAGLKETIADQRACRLILLTPACFAAGYRPARLLEPHYGVTPQLQAVAIGRPNVVSGWDYEYRRPKPTRRLAPAGTVYFLSFGNAQHADIEAWLDAVWMASVSDAEQDRLDGFGLAVIGAWDGILQQMEARA
jgi:CRISPR-associated protein Cmr3